MEKSIIQKMIDAEIISEKDIVEYYNNIKSKVENLPKKSEKPTYSIIEDGVLVKFDERDLNSRGEYFTPIGVHTIGERAFAYCINIFKVKLRRDVVEIKTGAFSSCSELQSVKMTNSVRKIGEFAFKNCYNLTEINLSLNLKEIQVGTFANCGDLMQIELPSKLELIHKFAFAYCRNLNIISKPSGNLLYVNEESFTGTPIQNDFMKAYYRNKGVLNQAKQDESI